MSTGCLFLLCQPVAYSFFVNRLLADMRAVQAPNGNGLTKRQRIDKEGIGKGPNGENWRKKGPQKRALYRALIGPY